MNVLRLTAFAACVIAALVLTGCKLGDSGSSSSGSGGSSYAGGSGATGGSTAGSSAASTIVHNPEPATMALLGSGLVAYALMMRNKRKKK